MTGLKISPDLTLPIDVAGEAIGILASRGAGKSYTSAVLVEGLWQAKVQFTVIDPTGVYWVAWRRARSGGVCVGVRQWDIEASEKSSGPE